VAAPELGKKLAGLEEDAGGGGGGGAGAAATRAQWRKRDGRAVPRQKKKSCATG